MAPADFALAAYTNDHLQSYFIFALMRYAMDAAGVRARHIHIKHYRFHGALTTCEYFKGKAYFYDFVEHESPYVSYRKEMV